MRYLIVVRHGEYVQFSGRLSEVGRRQMEALAESIKVLLDGMSVRMISSTAQRALDSAEVLSTVLQVTFDGNDLLWSDNMHRMKMEETLEFIRSIADQADVVILVTHIEYAEYLIRSYIKKISSERSITVEAPYNTPTGKGQAWILDCESLVPRRIDRQTV